jgi:hypothetical protein
MKLATRLKWYAFLTVIFGLGVLAINPGLARWPLTKKGPTDWQDVTLTVEGAQTEDHPAKIYWIVTGERFGPHDAVTKKWTHQIQVRRGDRVTLQAHLTFNAQINVIVRHNKKAERGRSTEARVPAVASLTVTY